MILAASSYCIHVLDTQKVLHWLINIVAWPDPLPQVLHGSI